MNTLQNQLLDDPEAFVDAFEPTYAVVVTEDHFMRGQPRQTYYQGPDGRLREMLTPGMTYGYGQARVVLKQALARRSQDLAANTRNIKIELQLVDPKLAQKNLDEWLAKREANRRAYQRRKERARLRAEQKRLDALNPAKLRARLEALTASCALRLAKTPTKGEHA